MALPVLKDRRQLADEWTRRFLSASDLISWFGPNSLANAWSRAAAGLAEFGILLYVTLLRRLTLLSAVGDALTDRAGEAGTERGGPIRSKVFVVVQPFSSPVLSITNALTSLIEVTDSSGFAVAQSIRIRNQDNTETEARTILAITSGTGPNGEDELEVLLLTGTYNPGTEDVAVLVRATLTAGAIVQTTAGINFQTLATVTTGDANPLLNGESTALALADKVWAEAVTPSAAGNVEALAVSGLATPVSGIVAVFNPEPGTGGSDEETDFDLKYRAMNRATLANQETFAWFEALARESGGEVLRAVRSDTLRGGVLVGYVLRNNGGTFSSTQIAFIERYMADRVRSSMTVSLSNLTLTAVEIEAEITMDPDVTLSQVWQRASQLLVTYLDFRKWSFGQSVDEAALLSIVRQTPGCASLVTETFLPASDVPVSAISLPVLARVSMRDTATGDTINALISVSFA